MSKNATQLLRGESCPHKILQVLSVQMTHAYQSLLTDSKLGREASTTNDSCDMVDQTM